VAAVSLMEPWISVAQKQGLRILIESHSTRSEAAGDDLLIWRSSAGPLIATPGADATMVVADGPVAVLRDARSLQSQIEPLLERCSTPEAIS